VLLELLVNAFINWHPQFLFIKGAMAIFGGLRFYGLKKIKLILSLLVNNLIVKKGIGRDTLGMVTTY
jgi:hypothetical protein